MHCRPDGGQFVEGVVEGTVDPDVESLVEDTQPEAVGVGTDQFRDGRVAELADHGPLLEGEIDDILGLKGKMLFRRGEDTDIRGEDEEVRGHGGGEDLGLSAGLGEGDCRILLVLLDLVDPDLALHGHGHELLVQVDLRHGGQVLLLPHEGRVTWY